MGLNAAQLKNQEYNLNQTVTGAPLKTLRGSVVKRSRFGVGKLIGGQLYFHKMYAEEVLDGTILDLINSNQSDCPFTYTCIRYDLKSGVIALVESPDFDTAREPVVGRMFTIKPDGSTSTSRFYNQIWHHKWLWVTNTYPGFDVRDSWEWSRKWLSTLTEPADGSNLENWKAQLSRFNLS